MKRCPTCGSTYTDDSLVYCLQDGATLQASDEATNPLSLIATMRDDDVAGHEESAPPDVSDLSSAPTVEIPAGALPTTVYQEPRATARATNRGEMPPAAPPLPPQQNSTRLVMLMALTIVLLVGAGGIGAWLFLRSDSTDSNNTSRAENVSSSNAGRTAETSETGAGVPSNSATKSGNTRGGENQPGKGGRWFVVLGSFPKDEEARANERVNAVRRRGFDARLVASDDYPNMKPGLWVVVMGPYTKQNAEEVLKDVRPTISDAYTKSGW